MIPPFLVRPLVICVTAAVLFGGGVWLGWAKRGEKEANNAAQLAAKVQASRQAVNDRLMGFIYNLAWEAETERRAREQTNQAAIDGLRNGTVRVRERFSCPEVPRDSAAPADSQAGTRGFQPEDAAAALGIARDADETAANLNICIAAYENVRAEVKKLTKGRK